MLLAGGVRAEIHPISGWDLQVDLAVQVVDLGRVDELTLGVGDPAVTGDMGSVLFDDIRLLTE